MLAEVNHFTTTLPTAMSYDIQVLVHRRQHSRWNRVAPSELEHHWEDVARAADAPWILDAWSYGEWYGEHNYEAFSIATGIPLCDPVPCGAPFTPIVPTRGLPRGVRAARSFGRDAGSWVTLEEAARFDWDARVHRFGYCMLPDYLHYRDAGGVGEPRSFARWVGPAVTVLSRAEAEQRIARGEFMPTDPWLQMATFVRVDWEVSHAAAAGALYAATIALARRLPDDVSKVRLTFRLD